MSHRSYGLVVYYVSPISKCITYHIVQRRDTVAYICFLRGKVEENNLLRYFSLMTHNEKERLNKYQFSELWEDLYYGERKESDTDEDYKHAYKNFIRLKESGKISELIKQSNDFQLDWGIPKGKKKHPDEPDLVCALREYKEETHNNSYIQFVDHEYLVDELKTDNWGTYITHFYIAWSRFQPRIRQKESKFGGISRADVSEETHNVIWATLEVCKSKLPPRLFDIIKTVDNLIKTTKLSFVLLKDAVKPNDS